MHHIWFRNTCICSGNIKDLKNGNTDYSEYGCLDDLTYCKNIHLMYGNFLFDIRLPTLFAI
jgi:hypothetical protein